MDGTLLRSDLTISAGMLDVATRLRRHNIWLTLASARPPRSVRSIARSLDAGGPFVTLNGSLIVSSKDEILWRRPLAAESWKRMRQRFPAGSGVSLSVYSGFRWIAAKRDEAIAEEARIVGFEPEISDLNELDVDKALLICRPGTEKEIRQEVLLTAADIDVTISKPGYVETTDHRVSKGAALQIAAELVGVPCAALLAAGDGENDLSMLRVCGYPVAMGHAPAALKQIARSVVGSSDDDSLPRLISSFIEGDLPTGR